MKWLCKILGHDWTPDLAYGRLQFAGRFCKRCFKREVL